MSDVHQWTIAHTVSDRGVGLHTGVNSNIAIRPSCRGKGIIFRRMDAGATEIPASLRFLRSTNYATRLAKGDVAVETVEHVLAALYACGIDQAVIELDGPEIPSMDGSSERFVSMIEQAGREAVSAPRTTIKVIKPVSLLDEDKSIEIYPSKGFHVTYTIEFDHPLLAFQKHTTSITRSTFATEIAPARTFGFLRDAEKLRHLGLARGGSLENAVVIGEDRVLNEGGLRYENECVRHKILDLVGDLALLGHRIEGHVVVHKGGHHLHTDLMRKLLARTDAYEIVTERVEAHAYESFAHSPATAQVQLAT